MASYLVTGASRGLGYEFVRQLSANPKNIVIGTVRSKAATEKKAAEELNRPNVYFVEADVTSFADLEKTVPEISKITGGSLDYLIANAGLVDHYDMYHPIKDWSANPSKLEETAMTLFRINVVGVIHTFNVYLPLLRKGRAKKAFALTTGFADDELTRKFAITMSGLYAISKSALNMAVAKFSAQYSEEGILFLAMSPGNVETGHGNNANEEEMGNLMQMAGKMMQFAPDWKGPSSPEDAVKAIMSVVDNASLEKGDGGAFLSHHGDRNWL